MRARRFQRGFLMADAMLAAMILSVAIGAAAAVMAAQAGARRRTEIAEKEVQRINMAMVEGPR